MSAQLISFLPVTPSAEFESGGEKAKDQEKAKQFFRHTEY